MPTTTNYGLRYPGSNDAPNGPQQIQNLATDVDTQVKNALTVQTGAVPPLGGFASYSSTGTDYDTASYDLFPGGLVVLRGMFRRTGATFQVNVNDLNYFATLPAAIRPNRNITGVGYIGIGTGSASVYACRLFYAQGDTRLGFIANSSTTPADMLVNSGYVNVGGLAWRI